MVKIVVPVAMYAEPAKPASVANASKTAVLVPPLTFVLSADRMSARTQRAMMLRIVVHVTMPVQIILPPMQVRTPAKQAFANIHATRDIQTVGVRQHQASTV